MTRVKCPCIECKHNKNGKCVAGRITLAEILVKGEDRCWKCRDYVMDEEYKRILESMKESMGL